MLGIIVLAGVFVYRIPYSRCDTPLTYKIGSIDEGFNVSLSTVLTDTKEAAEILGSAWGKTLFSYSSDSADLTINFVYDKRTALDQSVNKQQEQLTEENTTLQRKISIYDADVTAFEKKLADLNDTVAKYNNEGGAPPEVYADLVNRQSALKAEGDALNVRAKQLNLATRNYNSQVQDLNQDVKQFNQAIEQKPEEGVWDPATNTITIYFADSKPELIHTLAHEMGHALEMGHVEDELAIMYPNTTESLVMTEADKQQLEISCKAEPLPFHWIDLIGKRIAEAVYRGSVQN